MLDRQVPVPVGLLLVFFLHAIQCLIPNNWITLIGVVLILKWFLLLWMLLKPKS